MPPPQWLVQRWKENPNWVKRFTEGSFELNGILCGLPINKNETLWKPAAIKQFQQYMESVKKITQKPVKLYRGTKVPSPTMSPLAFELVSCQYLSTSKSAAIAKEYAGKGDRGFIHELHLNKGVNYYDLEDIYADSAVKREKEVILYPGSHLKLVGYKNNKFIWNVTAN